MNPNGSRDKVFKIAISPVELVDVQIHVPALRAQNLDLTPWASTYVLAGLLHKLDVDFSDLHAPRIPILELGAGIGLVGLVASMIWHRRAVLTDLGPIVPGLRTNIDLNSRLLLKCNGSASAGELDWENPQHLMLDDGSCLDRDDDKAHLILAADTIYAEDHPSLIAQTVLQRLAPGPKSRVVLTYALRVAYLDQVRELWQLLEAGGLEAVQEGQEEALEVGSDSWDDEKLCEWCVWRWRQM